jgi:hypothetical protein
MTIDPLTEEQVELFHPVRQRWSEHFRFKGYEIEGSTAVGRATVATLDLNHFPPPTDSPGGGGLWAVSPK